MRRERLRARLARLEGVERAAEVREMFPTEDGTVWLRMGYSTAGGERVVIEVPADEPTMESWTRRYGRPTELDS
jgi:hypothetical protein